MNTSKFCYEFLPIVSQSLKCITMYITFWIVALYVFEQTTVSPLSCYTCASLNISYMVFSTASIGVVSSNTELAVLSFYSVYLTSWNMYWGQSILIQDYCCQWWTLDGTHAFKLDLCSSQLLPQFSLFAHSVYTHYNWIGNILRAYINFDRDLGMRL